jgi:uncharacterized protein (DUF924 family)
MHNLIVDFWFTELRPEQWWLADTALDRQITDRFGQLHAKAAAAELWAWRVTALGRLAEIIILDQFSRNIYRGQAKAFAADSMALVLAQEAVQLGVKDELNLTQLPFLLMPYMHSESAKIHEQAVKLFSEPGLEANLKFEFQHKAIIDRFGRYPHRNEILERTSTAEEIQFLQQPNSKF